MIYRAQILQLRLIFKLKRTFLSVFYNNSYSGEPAKVNIYRPSEGTEAAGVG